MEFENTGATTINLSVPTEETFKQLIALKELPECTLEVAETRDVFDVYLDTPTFGLLDLEMDCRLSEVGKHHFLIFNEIKHRGKFLKTASEHVERLRPDEYASELRGERSHPLYKVVDAHVTGDLVAKLIRRSTFMSRMFKVGETRFELGLEAVVYDREGKQMAEQLLSIDVIEGEKEIAEAIAQYLKEKFELTFVDESPLARGLRLTA